MNGKTALWNRAYDRTFADELDAHLEYLRSIGAELDEAGRDALFAQLAEERGITVKDVNAQLIRQLHARVQRVNEEHRSDHAAE